MEENEYYGVERRKKERILYKRNQRASLKLLNNVLEIVDISQGGAKIIYDPDSLVLHRALVQGTIKFLNGQSVNIEGEVAWIIGNEVRLKFKDLVPSATFKKEQKLIAETD
jgi:hypothetical protein